MKSIIILICSLICQISFSNSYFSVLPSKKTIKIGEKFNLSVKFFYHFDSLEFSQGISYKFHNLSEDFQLILPKIQPNNCIIINRQIDEIINAGKQIINNKTYTVYEMVFMECYPIKVGYQKFSSFSVKLKKYNKFDSSIVNYKSKEFELKFIQNNIIGSIDGTNLASGDFKIVEEDSIFLQNENKFSVFLEGYGNYYSFTPTILNKNLIKWINTANSTTYDENIKANKSILRFDFLILNENIKSIILEKEIVFKYYSLKSNKICFIKPKNIVIAKSNIPSFKNDVKSNFNINYCIDVSGSMTIEDVKPNRFEAVRLGILDFLKNYKYENSTNSISFFATKVIQRFDKYSNENLTKDLKSYIFTPELLKNGTDITGSLYQIINLIDPSEERKNNVIFLFSDGVQSPIYSVPWFKVIEQAKLKNISIFAVNIGSNDSIYSLDELDTTIVNIGIQNNAMFLKYFSNKTSGSFFNAENQEDVEKIILTFIYDIEEKRKKR